MARNPYIDYHLYQFPNCCGAATFYLGGGDYDLNDLFATARRHNFHLIFAVFVCGRPPTDPGWESAVKNGKMYKKFKEAGAKFAEGVINWQPGHSNYLIGMVIVVPNSIVPKLALAVVNPVLSVTFYNPKYYIGKFFSNLWNSLKKVQWSKLYVPKTKLPSWYADPWK